MLVLSLRNQLIWESSSQRSLTLSKLDASQHDRGSLIGSLSAGRPALQAEGQRFDPSTPHFRKYRVALPMKGLPIVEMKFSILRQMVYGSLVGDIETQLM